MLRRNDIFIDSDDKCCRLVEANIEETNITDDNINSDDGNDLKNAEKETFSNIFFDNDDKNVKSVDIKDDEKIRSDLQLFLAARFQCQTFFLH